MYLRIYHLHQHGGVSSVICRLNVISIPLYQYPCINFFISACIIRLSAICSVGGGVAAFRTFLDQTEDELMSRPRKYVLTSLPLVSGNTYLTSVPLVSVRRHGRVTQ